MALRIIPPKQDGKNCVLVALCHAANYFGVRPSKRVYRAIVKAIGASDNGLLFTEQHIGLVVDFLAGLELTLLTSPNAVLDIEHPRLKMMYSKGNATITVPYYEAAIITTQSNEAGGIVGHAEFVLDRSTTGSLAWILFIHQPGVIRK